MDVPVSFIDFSQDAPVVARQLIGATFLANGVGGVIVETEAYDQTEPASHSYAGPTPRNRAMFGEPARLYVYRSYGIHWCVNFTCREAGHGSAVLIRAIEPSQGIPVMEKRRHTANPRLLCAGPGRLCQALGITCEMDGAPLFSPPFSLLPATGPVRIVSGTRIGISKAVHLPWRFGLANSAYLSRPFKKPA